MDKETKIAFGGGCHWCTEAVFQSLKGVKEVAQGFVASINENSTFSEAVVVHFNSEKISLKTLVEVHLLTHKSTSNHSMRKKYRSAIYTFSDTQKLLIEEVMRYFKSKSAVEIITQILDFKEFKPSEKQFKNYYYTNPKKPFCEKFINPKLQLLQERFSKQLKTEHQNHL
ncbi:peptide methionine sulfoxide reductase [Tenacibaculum todarodis]|uniref:peptide-methionine (S)-S-oxide reductase n=1 Tax=Tenacibaculum todarodis TaxID=1850252 RepID=A0A1L3JK37_9FLAO|nr:peptide-methionine (S)-S-oxide reductase [Tenacibaculum todarodis]APG65477.1 peptide methionine sulfoxide reductase [Tenacibaculum todarodis]